MSRTTHVFKRCAKGCAVLACVTIAFAVVVCTDALGIASRIPATSEVEQVAVRVDGMDAGTFASEQGVDQVRQLQGDILEYGGAKGLEEDYVQSDISLMYTLNNGQVLQRRYPVFYNGEDYFERAMDDRGRDLIDEVSAIANGDEGRESRFGKYFGDEAGGYKVTLRYYADSEDYSLVTLSAKDAKDFLQNALKPDVMHHSGGEFWVYANERSDEYDAWVELVGEDGYMPLNIWLGDQSTPNSVKWFKEHYSNIKLVHVAEGEAPLG